MLHSPACTTPHPRHLGARAAQGGSPGPKAGRWVLGRVGTRGTGGCASSVPNRPAGISSSHRSRPCLPPSVHPERLSLANPDAFRDLCSLLPPSAVLPGSSFPAVCVLAVSWTHRFSPVAGGMGDTLTPGDLVPTCTLVLHPEPRFSTLSPVGGWPWAHRTHLTARASQTQDFLKGPIW